MSNAAGRDDADIPASTPSVLQRFISGVTRPRSLWCSHCQINIGSVVGCAFIDKMRCSSRRSSTGPQNVAELEVAPASRDSKPACAKKGRPYLAARDDASWNRPLVPRALGGRIVFERGIRSPAIAFFKYSTDHRRSSQ
eukprot:7284439-Pyramimonas_sp.AAC.1